MEAPVPISAQLHSSTLVIIGFYLFFRLQVFFMLAPAVLSLCVIVGVFTSISASFLGFLQHDGKRLLACSTAGQLGYVVTTLGLGFLEEAQFLLVFCCCNKAITFVWLGVLMRKFSGVSDFRLLGGSPTLAWVQHLGILVAVSNFIVVPGVQSWHVKGLLSQGLASVSFSLAYCGLSFLQIS